MLSKHSGPLQATPYPLQRISPKISPVLVENSTNKIVENLNSSLNTKLQLLTDQIMHLKSVGEELIKKFHSDYELHNIPCSVSKKPGIVFYLYQRADDSKFLSIISPNEWRGLFEFKFLGSYALEADMSWSRTDDTQTGC